MPKAGRNAPCPCGSGKKYKHCCLPKDEDAAREASAQKKKAEAEEQRERALSLRAVRERIEAELEHATGLDPLSWTVFNLPTMRPSALAASSRS